MKKFIVCIAVRSMYNEYREYDNYYLKSKNLEKVRKHANEVVNKWNSKQDIMTYEVFSIEEVI